jgi:hypothetical protein
LIKAGKLPQPIAVTPRIRAFRIEDVAPLFERPGA